MRTTLNIDTPVLKDLKRLQRREGKPLGQLVSELLAQALAARQQDPTSLPFQWIARPMGARVDLADQDALNEAMDEQP